MTDGVFVSMDFNLPTREKPVFHAISEAPLCEQCAQNEPPFFNMNCQSCKHILKSPSTTVSQIFAIMRQWAPSTQRNIGLLVEEAIRRGANVNDRDSLTDMTMLHYCAKAGSQKIGGLEGVVCAIRTLLQSSADVEARCSWVDMTALHFAALFNAPEVIGILVREGNADQQALSREYDDGNALHIAARALSLEATRTLLRLDCDPQLEDSRCLKPVECMPQNYGHIECEQSRILEVVDKIHQEFAAFESTNVVQARTRRQSEDTAKGSPRRDRPLIHRVSGSFATLESLGLSIGDRVLVNRNRQGILRFFGKTEFQSGLWAGVELEDCSGRNDGSVGNYRYFSCKSKYGIFCAPSKLLPIKDAISPDTQHTSSSMDTRNRSESGLAELPPSVRPCSAASSSTASTSAVSPYLEVGASVTIAGGKKGVIQFIGEVKFQNGMWIGVECNEAVGKNDGSIDGIRYFRCRSNHGVFVPPNKVFRDDIPPSGMRPTRVSTMDSATSRRSKLYTSRSVNLNTTTSAPRTPDLTLAEGMSVLYLLQRETGIVRYIGPTELGDGLWIGVEFSKPIGKTSEGKVNIRDYFKCKPNYGLLIRPSKLTFRGINCHKIMPTMN